MNKKIVFITSSFPFGKSEVWAINEINSLQDLGNEVTIIPRSGQGTIINKDAIKFSKNLIDLPYINLKILIFFLKSIFLNPLQFLKLIIGIIMQSNTVIDFLKALVIFPKSVFSANLLHGKNVDHIHSFSTTSAAVMAYIISSKLKVSWSYTLHSSSVLNSKYKRSFLFHSNSASKCRTISKVIANDLSNFIGPSLAKKVHTVHLGVDINDFIKEKININNPMIIATPAELKIHKGHIYAINAASKLIKKGFSNFKWFFYGSGPLLNELKEKVKELNLINHCYFPGNIDHQELLNKYKRHEVDVVISSSITIPDVFEGIPVSLMEAMSYGIPVVATDSGGTRELVDGKSGILVKQNDAKALLSAIIDLIEKPEYRRELSKNGRNKVKQDFNTIKNANDLIKLF